MPTIFAPLLLFLQAEEGGEPVAPSTGPNFLFPLLLVFAIFWFVLILPERKQRKKRQAMLDSMQKGERVLTTGGIYGTVVQVQDDVVTVQIAEGVRVRFARAAVQNVLREEAPAEKAGAEAKEKK